MTNTNTRIWVGNLGKYNEGISHGAWLDFPFTEEEFYEFLEEKVGIGEEDEFGQPYEEWHICDYESELDIKIAEYMSVEELVKLSEQIEFIEYYRLDIDAINAYMEENSNDLDEAVGYIHDGRYLLLKGVDNYEDLGMYFFKEYGYEHEVSEQMIDYIDFEKFGRDKADGTLTKYGYFESW